MKILKWIAAILFLLVIVFLLLGVFTKSITYTSEIVVDKPATEAWSVMQDESKLPQWLTGFVKYEPVSGVSGTVGAVSNVHIENNGTVTIIKETITEQTPNKVMAMDFSMDPMDMSYRMTFEENGGTTKIKSSTTTKGNGMFMRSMVSIMKGGMKSQEDINMGKLKKLINENTDVY